MRRIKNIKLKEMKRKPINTTLLATVTLLAFCAVSCDEFPPVKYDDPEPYEVYSDEDFSDCTLVTVKELKDMYKSSPVNITDNIYIKAQVISSDQSGNLYRTMYLQDATAGIELKIGTRNLYNDYKLGQWVYVKLRDLTLGDYNGMVGIGYRSHDPEYETAYIENQYIIDTHIFRGAMDEPVEPLLLESDGDIRDEGNFGKYVTIEGLTYSDKLFVILYYDPDGDHQDYQGNCVFLDEESGEQGYGNYGIDTWAISENAFQAMLDDPEFDFNGFPDVDKSRFTGPYSYTVSQYFRTSAQMGGMDLQIRTSGYARFADTQIDSRILEGEPFNATGILTYYNSGSEPNYQFTLLDLGGIEIPE